jgi:exosortase/archaeosortase family protein
MHVSRQMNLRFTVVMAVFVAVVLLTYQEDIVGPFLTPLTMLTAQMTLALLHWIGMEAVRASTVISHPDGFAYEIYYRCTGFLPVAFLTVSILASPGPLRRRLVGLVVGVPILVGLNLVRLVHLFSIGVHNPAAFDVAHAVVWEGFFILAIFGLWLGSTRWSMRGQGLGPKITSVRGDSLDSGRRPIVVNPSKETGCDVREAGHDDAVSLRTLRVGLYPRDAARS